MTSTTTTAITLYWDSPGWGRFLLTANSYVLMEVALALEDESQDAFSFMAPGNDLKPVTRENYVHWVFGNQLNEYLNGERKYFEDIQIDPSVLGEHQLLFEAVQNIPYGETVTYEELAVQVSMPNAVNHMKAEVLRIPLPILIPGHRVIHSMKDCGGYVFRKGFKQRLLKLEANQRRF